MFGFLVYSNVGEKKYRGLFATETEWGFSGEIKNDREHPWYMKPKPMYNKKYPVSSFKEKMINHPLRDELYDLLLYLQRAPYVRNMEFWTHEKIRKISNIEDADEV
jgi:hypothetical protein